MSRALWRPTRIRSTQYIAAAILVAAFVAAVITGFVWASKDITVVVDGRPSVVRTQARDVASFLSRADVKVSDGDLVNPGLSAPIFDGTTIVVRHAVPVTLKLGGDHMPLKVVGARVADALVAAGLDPSAGIAVSPGVNAPLSPGMTITAADVFLRVTEESLAIPPRSLDVTDPAMPVGTRRLVRQGMPGRLLRVHQSVVVGGRETGRVLKAEQVVREPIDALIAVGVKHDFRGHASEGARLLVASRQAPPILGRRLTVVATAYAPNAESGGPRSATGAILGYGIIAVDPRVIPLGTRLYVPGYGYGVAADTGGAIKGDRIDVCFESESRVDDWGVQTVTITILP